ncbi:TonB-dependent receptor [Alteromonas sp. A081]|uniref:TonB-dependent receptor n=1 Tax=Alteromonas sp. A081 TaxID=3410269 RepID=UPI003B98450A
MHTRKVSLIAMACTAAMQFVAPHALAAEESQVVGVVTNVNSSKLFAGAKIDIKALGISVYADKEGRFRIPRIAPGQYTVEIDYLGAQTSTQTIEVNEDITNVTLLVGAASDTLEELLVRGQRSGQANAINKQRMSDGITSVVSADAIGQFPDQNAAESLQRLPGLSIERDQGEGRFVGIRGIDPNLNNVTINGLNIPSPEGGVRSVALDVIPSELISSLTVSKSVTSDMDADTIGGNIEVKSVSAFDRANDSASFTAQLSQNELRDALSPKLAGSVTHKLNDKWGFAAALSYFDREFGSDNIETNGDDEIEQRHYAITRERLGGAVNIDFRPDFNNQYYLRTLYSRFSDSEFRQANVFVLDGEDSEVERESKDRFEEQSILSISAGAEHQRDAWTISYQAGYSRSDEDEPDALYYVFTGAEAGIEGDLEQRIPQLTVPDALNDLGNYELDQMSFERNNAKDTELSFRLDIAKQIEWFNSEGEMKFGTKYRAREKRAVANIDIFDGGFDDFNNASFAAASPEYTLGNFGPGFNRGALRDNFNQQRGQLELAELDSRIESQGGSFTNDEDIFAAYAMTRFDWEKLRLVAGLRYESTSYSTSGSQVSLTENDDTDSVDLSINPVNASRDYDNVFPSINLRYAFTEKLIARAAFTQTLSRPSFEDAAAFQIIEANVRTEDGEQVIEREASVGNPDLLPYEADNFDLMLEYYPGDIGVISAGLFHKRIDNFIVEANVAGTGPWEGFEEAFQPVNGEEANLTGLELSWMKSFNNGLLLSANGTFSNSDAVTMLDGERFETNLPNQSDTVGNVVVGYENDKLSLRLSMTYKSDNLEEIDGGMLRIEDDHQQLDFVAKYYINNDMQVYFNGINLGDEPLYNFFDERNRNAQFEQYGRTFEIGFIWRTQ